MSSFVKFQAEKEFDLLSQIGKKSSARWHFSLSPQQTTEVVDKLWQCWLEPLKNTAAAQKLCYIFSAILKKWSKAAKYFEAVLMPAC